MSYAVNPSAPRGRPGIVTAAAILLFIAAAALVVEAIIQFSVIGPVTEQLDPLYQKLNQPAGARSVATGMFGSTAAGALFFAVVFGLLGALDLAGKNWARICSWVFGGLGMLCCGCTSTIFASIGFADLAAQVQEQSPSSGDNIGPPTKDFMEALNRGIPDWYTLGLIGLAAVMVIAVLVAMILLSLPAASEHFRKPTFAWVPPTASGPAPGVWSGYGPPPTDPSNPPATAPLPPASGALPPPPSDPPPAPDTQPDEPRPDEPKP